MSNQGPQTPEEIRALYRNLVRIELSGVREWRSVANDPEVSDGARGIAEYHVDRSRKTLRQYRRWRDNKLRALEDGVITSTAAPTAACADCGVILGPVSTSVLQYHVRDEGRWIFLCSGCHYRRTGR